VDFERLRFDFHCPRAVTVEELERIEALINGWIADAHSLEVAEMAIEKAKAAGAVAMFGEKYADVVRVVDVPGVSMELCGGTHVSNTAEIGLFKIVSESGVAAGIRRIEAVAGPAVLAYLNERDAVVKQLGDRFKAQPAEIVDRVVALQAFSIEHIHDPRSQSDSLLTPFGFGLLWRSGLFISQCQRQSGTHPQTHAPKH